LSHSHFLQSARQLRGGEIVKAQSAASSSSGGEGRRHDPRIPAAVN
jgi:hypothetical protein